MEHDPRRTQLEHWRVHRLEQMRAAYLYMRLIPEITTPNHRTAFIGPGDYQEVHAVDTAIRMNHQISWNAPLPFDQQTIIVDHPEAFYGRNPRYKNVPYLAADYLQEQKKVFYFLHKQQAQTIIMRNPPVEIDWESHTDFIVNLFAWAKQTNRSMLLTLRDTDYYQPLDTLLIALGSSPHHGLFDENQTCDDRYAYLLHAPG